MGIVMIGGMLLFWVILIALAVLLVRVLFHSNPPSKKGSTDTPLSAREILEQRYARGEINREQYILMSRDVQS